MTPHAFSLPDLSTLIEAQRRGTLAALAGMAALSAELERAGKQAIARSRAEAERATTLAATTMEESLGLGFALYGKALTAVRDEVARAGVAPAAPAAPTA